ncbi:MAG TPA: hypothetical protein PKL84_02085 [Candidatus Hydrogenedentes bacterium]|nr:hypothetical protein [Candidatus Hydrogenedentota bacterium]
MLIRGLWNLASRAGTVLLAFYLGSQAWDAVGPKKPEISPLRVQVADEAVPVMLRDLRDARDGLGTVALLPFAGDSSGYVTNQLRSAVSSSGILDLRDRTLTEKARAFLDLRETGVGEPEAARATGHAMGVEGVLFGTVRAFESFGGEAALDLEVRLLDVASGALLLDRRYTKETAPGILNTGRVREEIARINAPKRFFAWLIAVLLLPVFTIGFIRAMVRKDTNRSNAATLVIYSAADALLAYLLLGAALSSWFALLLFLVAVGFAICYNAYIMRFALRLEGLPE